MPPLSARALQLLLLAAVALLSGAAGTDGTDATLRKALAAHLGPGGKAAAPASWAAVGAALRGRGFHRTLRYELTLGCRPPAQRGQEALTDPWSDQPCIAALLQPLPAGVFASPYELRDAAAAGRGPPARLFGAVDVESIAAHSRPSVLALYRNLTLHHWPAAPPVPGEVSEQGSCFLLHLKSLPGVGWQRGAGRLPHAPALTSRLAPNPCRLPTPTCRCADAPRPSLRPSLAGCPPARPVPSPGRPAVSSAVAAFRRPRIPCPPAVVVAPVCRGASGGGGAAAAGAAAAVRRAPSGCGGRARQRE